MYEIEAVLWTAVGMIVVVVTCYIGTRVAAVAWFRTKLEFIRSVMKEGKHPNGH